MTVQKSNDELVEMLSAWFQRRSEPNFALAKAASTVLALPGLRGFWPMSAFGDTGNAYDQSGNTRTLTYNGNPTYAIDGLIPHIRLDGTGDYLARTDEAGLDIQGNESYVNTSYRGLFMGGWFLFSAAAGSVEIMMSKWLTAGNQEAYKLQRNADGTISFVVTTDGSTDVTVTSTDVPAIRTWFFAWGRFDPSTQMSVGVNGARDDLAAGVPATIFNSNADFRISGDGAAANLLSGYGSMCFLSAMHVPNVIPFNLYQQARALFGA